jgi:hypothetical protein
MGSSLFSKRIKKVLNANEISFFLAVDRLAGSALLNQIFTSKSICQTIVRIAIRALFSLRRIMNRNVERCNQQTHHLRQLSQGGLIYQPEAYFKFFKFLVESRFFSQLILNTTLFKGSRP